MTIRESYTIDLQKVCPYGDTYNDGMVQLSFTLPIPQGPRAGEAAKILMIHMGFKDPIIVHDKDIGEGFTYFIAFGKTEAYVDYEAVEVVAIEKKTLSRTEIDALIRERFGRPLRVLGACTGDDAHTVGIDAILNMKGVDHHYGLERYEMFEVHNLGSQGKNEELIAKALELQADAVLVSQVVTQKDTHIANLKELMNSVQREDIASRRVIIAGGPRITHELALSLGFDGGFGSRTYPEDVGIFIADTLWEKMKE